nr:fasciclin domain-containing protein [uncultured Pedobacter sp.]
MTKIFKYSYYILLCALVATISSCNKWDDHNVAIDGSLNKNLLEQIKENPDLSKFNEYLVKTGYDSVLSSSKTLTVWAPTNAALAALDPAIVNDVAQLKLVIGNHIANLSYFTTEPNPESRVRTLSNKNVVFTANAYGEANIVSSNKLGSNGVLHVVDMAIVPKLNILEYLNASTDGNLQKAEFNSLNYTVRDPSKSEVIGYDQSTGQPIYKEGLGLVNKNKYLDNVNIANEDSVYTYIVLTDAAYTAEKSKLTPYFATDDPLRTDTLANRSVINDLAIRGRYDANNLPAQLYSLKDSVVYTLDKNAIVKTYQASNGVVYVMNKLDYDMVSKLKPVKIQGESGYTLQSSKTVTIRQRRNSTDINDPLYRSFFRDLLIENHGVASYWVKYQPELKAAKYKVYFRSVRDFNLIPAVGSTDIAQFRIKFAFGLPTATDIPYFENAGVVKNSDGTYSPDYKEEYAGEYTVTKFGKVDFYMVANNIAANTATASNTLLLDYVKLVPVP